MTNKLIGIGKVTNGRIMFSTVDGNGFYAPKSKPVVKAPSKPKADRIDIAFTFAQKHVQEQSSYLRKYI